MVETDDAELLGLLRNQITRKDGFKLVLEKYQRKIYYFLRKMGLTHEDADEQVQEIFLRFWRKPNELKEHDRLDIALYRIAVETSFIFLRKQGGFIMNGLAPEQKVIFTLKQQEEFDFREISDLTNLPVNDVKEYFKLALNQMMANKNQG